MTSTAFRPATLRLALVGALTAALLVSASPAPAQPPAGTSRHAAASAVFRAAAAPKGRTLAIRVIGLRPGMTTTVTVKGPKRYKKSKVVASTATVKRLRPGRYRVRALPVTFDGVRVPAAPARSTVRVTKRRGTTVTMTYTDPGRPAPGGPGDDQPFTPGDQIPGNQVPGNTYPLFDPGDDPAPGRGPQPPVITTTTLPDATSRTPYSTTLAASGAARLYWSADQRWLPSGMYLLDNGRLTGTPAEKGTFTFTVVVKDLDSQLIDSQVLSLLVRPRTASGPQITTTSLPTATAGRSYSGKLASTGGTEPVRWHIAAGSPPDGLYLVNEVIQGYPSKAGTGSFTVEVTDDDGRSASKQLSISVVEFAITGTLPPAYLDVPYSATLGSLNGTAPVSFYLLDGTLPDGLELSDSGLISGVATSGDSRTFTIGATDDDGIAARQQFTLQPTTSPTPVIRTTSLPRAQQGVPYAATVASVGGTGRRTLSVTSGSLPNGLTLNGAGLISGTPTARGTSNFTLTVTDTANKTGRQALSVVVSPASDLSWSQNGRDAQQSAFAPDENVVTPQNVAGLHQVWSVPKASGTPAVRDGVLYSPGSLPGERDETAIIAYRLSTGDELWRVTAGGCGFGDVAVTDAAVITSCSGKPRAYDRNGSHALLWDTATTDPQAGISQITVAGDRVIGNDGEWVYAFRADTGARIWRQPVSPGSGSTSIAVSGSTAVVPMIDKVRAFNTANGSILWTVATASASTPMIVAGDLYVVTGGELTKRSLTTGALLWTTATSGAIRAAMATDGTHIIALWETSDFTGVTNKLQAYRLADGTLAWENSAPVRPRAVSVAGELIWISYAHSHEFAGGVSAHRLSDGQQVRDLYTSGNRVFSRVIPAEGRVVLSMGTPQDNNLLVYGFGAASPTITTTALKAGRVGQAYSETLTSAGGTSPTSWSLASGSLPAGLSLSRDGLLTGTPTAAGSSPFEVRLTDDFGITVKRRLVIQVNPGGGNQTWPTSGGSNTRRGLADKENLDSDDAATWSQKWRSAVLPDKYVNVEPVVGNGRLYFPGTNTVLGFSLSSGSTTNRAPTFEAVTDSGAELMSNVTLDGDRLYVVATDGLYAFDATTGAKVWKVALSASQYVPGPIVVGTRVIVADDSGILRSFATSDGGTAWSKPLDLPGTDLWVGQLASDGTKVFGMQCTTAYGINANTGALLWNRVMPGTEDFGCYPFATATTPLVHDGLVYFGSWSTAALRISDGAVRWSRSYSSGGAMALSHNVLVLTDLSTGFGGLRGVDPSTGTLRWSNSTDVPAANAPAVTVVDDVALTNGSSSALGLDIRSGERLWASDQISEGYAIGAQVIPVGERLYFVGTDHRVHAYGGG